MLQRALATLTTLCAAGAAFGADIRAARYDAASDTVVVEIAYRGTHSGHDFSVQWDECDDGRTVGRLTDAQGGDAAREAYQVRRTISLQDIPCRPATATLRLGRVSHATVHVPQAKGREARASALIGRAVQAPGGDPLGEIAGLLIDSRRAGVHFALLETPRGERFAYPVHALAPGNGALELDALPQRLALKPGYEGRRWPDPAYRLDTRYLRAAALLGAPAEDALGNVAGEIADVVVSLDTGRTRYVLVDFAGDGAGALPLAPHLVQLRPGASAVIRGGAQRRS